MAVVIDTTLRVLESNSAGHSTYPSKAMSTSGRRSATGRVSTRMSRCGRVLQQYHSHYEDVNRRRHRHGRNVRIGFSIGADRKWETFTRILSDVATGVFKCFDSLNKALRSCKCRAILCDCWRKADVETIMGGVACRGSSSRKRSSDLRRISLATFLPYWGRFSHRSPGAQYGWREGNLVQSPQELLIHHFHHSARGVIQRYSWRHSKPA